MKTVSSLKFVRKLGFLALACSAVLFSSSCGRNEVFTKSLDEAKKIKDMLPTFGRDSLSNTKKVWDDIAKAVEPAKLDSLLVVVYDDLMNLDFFKSIISQYPIWYAPVDVMGSVRRFNFHPAGPTSQVADINAEVLVSGTAASKTFSAVCCDVNYETFEALCKEYNVYYDLIPVVVASKIGEGYTIAFMFSVRDPKFHSSTKALPISSRFKAIWETVNSIPPSAGLGFGFASEYLNTTFLADGRSITTILPPKAESAS